jgi:hypothetical protein
VRILKALDLLDDRGIAFSGKFLIMRASRLFVELDYKGNRIGGIEYNKSLKLTPKTPNETADLPPL